MARQGTETFKIKNSGYNLQWVIIENVYFTKHNNKSSFITQAQGGGG